MRGASFSSSLPRPSRWTPCAFFLPISRFRSPGSWGHLGTKACCNSTSLLARFVLSLAVPSSYRVVVPPKSCVSHLLRLFVLVICDTQIALPSIPNFGPSPFHFGGGLWSDNLTVASPRSLAASLAHVHIILRDFLQIERLSPITPPCRTFLIDGRQAFSPFQASPLCTSIFLSSTAWPYGAGFF